jgi:hypothetical protein
MSVLCRCLLVVATTAALGCREEAKAPAGPPSLLQVLWEVDGLATLVWSRDADAAVAAAVPAAGFKIDFVFDRRLDGARVEDSVDNQPVPKANPPITVSWPDMATVMSDPPFAFDVFYNSLPSFGSGTSSVFVQAHRAGFPSATPVTFTLDPNGLTSVYGEPMIGPTQISAMTEALAVTLPFSSATVSTAYRAPISFSTRGPAASTLLPFVHVAAAGQPLPFDLVYDGGDPKRALLLPRCGGGWPPGVRVEVSVDAGVPDGFGRPLAAPVKGSFMTAPIAPSADGSCGFDAGSGDAGPNDTDAGTGDAPADDGGTTGADAGVDAQSN